MSLSYASLCQIRLSHDYFPQSDCPSVDVMATTATMAAMHRMNLRMVRRDYGAEIFIGQQAGERNPLLDRDDAFRLSFWLRPTDPSFRNYTDLPPLHQQRILFYTTNLETTEDTAHFYPINDSGWLPLKPATFSHQPQIATADDCWLADELGNDLSDRSILTDGSRQGIEVNTKFLPAGRYFLMEGGAASISFLSENDGHKAGDLGLVSLYIGDLGERGSRLLTGDSVLPASYTIAFTARSTRWRYNIIDRRESAGNELRITGGEEDGIFFSTSEHPETRQMPDGSTATILTSDAAIPLRQRPDLQLKLETSAGYSIILPAASSDRLSRDESQPEGVFFSDLYVYL